ncbi:MAG: outer membrane beta-barrel protein [Opitutus sp.]
MACPPAHALVRLNDGRDQIHVTFSANVSSDSNVYANSDDKGDVIYSSGITADYVRRAGWIGVNASIAVSAARFGEFNEENYSNPSYSLEFTKQSGRTTGSVAFQAQRESRADAAVNIRSESWNYSSDLNVKYPINGVLSAAGMLGYSNRDYIDESLFSDLSTYAASLDFFYVISSLRDLSVGYRYRYNETSRSTSAGDHGINVGMHGRLIRGVKGNLRVGYQTRKLDTGLPTDARFNSWTAGGSASYALGRRISLTGQISKDFSVTATEASVDSTSASLEMQFTANSRLSAGTSLGWGQSKFLGDTGRIVVSAGPPPVLGGQRQDDYLNLGGSLNFSLNEHLRLSASYSWFKNWSTLEYADFVRNAWSVNMVSRW